MSQLALTKTKCLKCGQEIFKGDKLEIVNGKKEFPSFDLDGTTRHVCKPKESGKKFIPQKPREEFTFEEFRRGKLPDGADYARTYRVTRTGFVGELSPSQTFAEMQKIVWGYIASEAGNPVHLNEEPRK